MKDAVRRSEIWARERGRRYWRPWNADQFIRV